MSNKKSSNNGAAKESTVNGQKEASMVAAAWTAGFHRRVDKIRLEKMKDMSRKDP